MTVPTADASADDARRALVLLDRSALVDLIELTLNHGLFVVRAARNLAEAEAILAAWQPHMAVVDMDHDDSAELLLQRLGASNSLSRERHAGPRPDPPGRPPDEAQGVRSRRRRHPDGALLARGAARPIDRDHPAGVGTDRPIVPTIRLGEMEIDIVNREVRAGDSVIHLSGIEQSLLYLLASRGGQVVTRDEILDAIWGTDFVAESNIVDRHVRSLRIKLQNDYRHPRFIATVPGKGYRFIPTFSNQGWDGGEERARAVDALSRGPDPPSNLRRDHDGSS